MGATWILLEYANQEKLASCLGDRDKSVLFYPAIGQMQAGQIVDVDVVVASTNVQVPMRAVVIARRTRPKGAKSPRGVYLEVIPDDRGRFARLCDFADGAWEPGTRRAEPRIRAELRVAYYVPPRFHPGTTLDISAGGMFVRTDGPLPEIGKGVYLKLYRSVLLPPIRLSARTCWIDRVDTRRGMGVNCFDTPRALRRLSSLVERQRRRNRP